MGNLLSVQLSRQLRLLGFHVCVCTFGSLVNVGNQPTSSGGVPIKTPGPSKVPFKKLVLAASFFWSV